MSNFKVEQEGEKARVWFGGVLVAEIHMIEDAEDVALYITNKRRPRVDVRVDGYGDEEYLVEIYL